MAAHTCMKWIEQDTAMSLERRIAVLGRDEDIIWPNRSNTTALYHLCGGTQTKSFSGLL
jgi:hypothetical protein